MLAREMMEQGGQGSEFELGDASLVEQPDGRLLGMEFFEFAGSVIGRHEAFSVPVNSFAHDALYGPAIALRFPEVGARKNSSIKASTVQLGFIKNGVRKVDLAKIMPAQV